jgi:hypothetical protein
MKSHNSAVLSAVLGLFVAAGTGRAAVVLSNLGQTAEGYDYVTGPDSAEVSHAVQFTTGPNVGGYSLDSVRISIRNVSGTTVANGNFTLSIYNNSGTTPGSVRALLSGPSDPSASGLHVYAASSVSLSALTTYWVVARVTAGDSTYLWNFANSTATDLPDMGWTLSSTYADSFTAGVAPWILGSGNPDMLEINATAVPEPAEYASIAGIAGMLVAGWMRRRRQG